MLTTPESLEQTYRVRLALEPAALLEPAYRLDPDTAARCREASSGFSPAPSRRTARMRCMSAACASTRRIVGASGNPFFLETDPAHQPRSAPVVLPVDARPERYPQHCREHLKILDLIARERNDEAAAALRRHLEGTMHNLRKIKALLDPKGNGAVLE